MIAPVDIVTELLKQLEAKPELTALDQSTELGQLATTIRNEVLVSGPRNREFKPGNSPMLKKLKTQPILQAQVLRHLFINRLDIMLPSTPRQFWNSDHYPLFVAFTTIIRGNPQIEPDELLDWIFEIKVDKDRALARLHVEFQDWPISYMVQLIERKSVKAPLTKTALNKLTVMTEWSELKRGKDSHGFGVDMTKVATRIQSILQAHADGADTVVPYKKLSGDAFGPSILAELDQMGGDKANKWHRIFNHAATATGSKPTKKFANMSDDLKADLGKDWVRHQLQHLLSIAMTAKVVALEHDGPWTEMGIFTKSNAILMKGVIWIAAGYQDTKTVNLVADLCEKSMRKIPGFGPAAQAVANACLGYLELTPGKVATARLARLGIAITQKSVQKRVVEIVAKKAEAAGMSTMQLAERVVPTFGLTQGEKTLFFNDYALHIKVDGPNRISQTWTKPDGTPQKTKPSIISTNVALKADFNATKAEIANLKKILTSQRDRIDRLFAEAVEWSLDEVMEYYVGHNLVCAIATKLIWMLRTDGKDTAALFQDGQWHDVDGQPVKTAETTVARLWHPVEHSVDEIMAWRARISVLDIQQPTKQAYREVYVLTDAERKTDVYSNRMAAHMLKQHQMATLMAARGWRYQLLGAFEDISSSPWATKSFGTSDLFAELLINTYWDEDNRNDFGIYTYVGTDQLRFTCAATPVKLDTVPARLLSETMRDADLFVGVASVGNDALWYDQGPTPEAQGYWEAYSFGALDTFAETRKQVLEALLPRLKIRDKARIDGKYLIVDGKLNSYKIHLRSANILMAPGDRYLCIVPDAVAKEAAVALPFDGETRLSVILSKAMMLADDDKITAPDIISQLGR